MEKILEPWLCELALCNEKPLKGSFPQGVQISENAESTIIEACLPGLEQSEIEILQDERILTIRGEKKAKEDESTRNYYQRFQSSYLYQFELPDNLDSASMPKAEFKNGVVKITFTKQKESPPKRILFSG